MDAENLRWRSAWVRRCLQEAKETASRRCATDKGEAACLLLCEEISMASKREKSCRQSFSLGWMIGSSCNSNNKQQARTNGNQNFS